MSLEETAEENLNLAVVGMLRIPRPETRRKVFTAIFNALLAKGEIEIESRII